MTITINRIPVDFQLEGETTWSDLESGLLAWADAQGMTLTGALADGRVPEAHQALAALERIEVEAVTRTEAASVQASVLAEYFDLAAGALEGGRAALAQDLEGEFPGLEAAASALLAPWGPTGSALVAALKAPWGPATAPAARQAADLAQTRTRELADPQGALAEAWTQASRLETTVRALAEAFQQGRDREGYGLILEVFALLGDLGRRVPPVLAGHRDALGSWEGTLAGLAPVLAEAQGALEAGDFVLLTDLLEYEVAPRVEEARQALAPFVLDPAKSLP